MSGSGAAGEIIIILGVMFFGAKIAAEIMARLKQPTVIGELAAGIILGPSFFNMIHDSVVYEVLAELGVVFLLFMVGLETRWVDLKKVGNIATLVAILGVIVPFGLGFALMMALSYSMLVASFIGAAMVATSVGITASVLREMDVLGSTEARIILGAAIVDDVLGLIVLTLVTGVGSGHVVPLDILVLIVEAVVFVVILMVLGSKVVDRVTGECETVGGVKIVVPKGDLVGRVFTKEGIFVAALITCFALSALAQTIGLASIIGAFLAGMAFSNVSKRCQIEENMRPIGILMVPFFFVVTGAKIDLHMFMDSEQGPGLIGLTIVLIIVASVGKYFGCGFGARKLGKKSKHIIGLGMVPRGEVGIIIAAVGLGMGTLDEGLFAAVVMMSIATTLIAPPLLKSAYHSDSRVKVGPKKVRPDKATVTGPMRPKKGWGDLNGKVTVGGKRVARKK